MGLISDTIPAFIAAMEAAGMAPAEPIASLLGSDLIRFDVVGDTKGRKNGWAVLHLDGRPAGAFGSYRLGISEKWRADSTERLAPAERRDLARRYREERERREAERLNVQREAAAACLDRWERAGSVHPTHPYLVRKGIVGEGLRQSGNRLLVPMYDGDGELWNLQAIDGDGVKRFVKGGRQAGLHLLLGGVTDKVVIGEGYGTCAVIRRATGLPVVVAFSAKNLTAVAVDLRNRHPDAEIIIGADDDTHLVAHPTIKRNLGLEEARAAAQAVGGRLAIPPRKAA